MLKPKEDDITTTHSTSKHKDIENKIGGKTKHAIELAMSIPEDLSYVLQPFVIWVSCALLLSNISSVKTLKVRTAKLIKKSFKMLKLLNFINFYHVKAI